MVRKLFLGFSAICLLVVGGIGIATNVLYHENVPNCSCAPGPAVWNIRSDQLSFKSVDGLFALKWVAITPQEFHFFYAFQFHEPGNLRIVVKSYVASRPQSTSNLAITVQPLGRLGPYTISVLHVKRSSYAGQVLSLQITSPGESRFTWSLTPLVQVSQETHENTAYYGFFLDTTTLNEVSWHEPAMDQQVSYLEYKAKMGQAYLYLKRGDPFVVTVITRSEYLSRAGSL
jgi:hypothetical protein